MLAVVETKPVGNTEAEAALCGGLMHANGLIDVVSDIVKAEDFVEPLLGRIFSAIQLEHSRGRSANPITLCPHFASDEAMQSLGGAQQFLPQLLGSHGAHALAAKDFAGQIREMAQRRRLLDGLREAISDPNSTAAEIVSLAEEAVAVATMEDDGTKQLSAAECISRVVDGLNDNDQGIRSGIGALDATLGAICRRNLVIMGGRPGMGKSAVASTYALGAASRGHGTLFVSLEMGAEELGERMAADLCFDSNCQVPYGAITSGKVTGEQAREMSRAGDRIRDLPLSVIDIGSATLSRLNGLVRRHKRRMAAKGQRLELVIVDYLQLVSPDQREQTPYAAVSAVSRGLKALAKTHDVAVLALTQLSRKVEDRGDRRPHMSDLRDSGQIEQDADAIVFLYAEEYYLLQCPESPERNEALVREAHKIEFIVAKRRRGPGGMGEGQYFRQFQAVR